VVVQSLLDVLGGLTKSNVDGEYDRLDVEDQLTDLRLMTSYLENELKVVRQENADFRRDMMTSSVRNQASLSSDDVSRLMEKLVELMNGSVVGPSLVKHATVGFPRGKPPARCFLGFDSWWCRPQGRGQASYFTKAL